MRTEYSDSFLPAGIGTSFILLLTAMLFCGLAAGFIFHDSRGMEQSGAVPLLIVFLVLLVFPRFYIRRKSPFERDKKSERVFESFCSIQGLRGTFVRVLVYEGSIEIRAFYHRYHLPFNKITSVHFDEGKFSSRLEITSEIDNVPEYIVSSGEEFISMALLIREKFKKINRVHTKKHECDD